LRSALCGFSRRCGLLLTKGLRCCGLLLLLAHKLGLTGGFLLLPLQLPSRCGLGILLALQLGLTGSLSSSLSGRFPFVSFLLLTLQLSRRRNLGILLALQLGLTGRFLLLTL